MPQPDWRFASATAIGTSHVKTGTPCQDHHTCRVFRNGEGEPIIAIAVSDGAGSAIRGGDGVIVVKDQTSQWSWVFWPDRGEFANTTFFVTDAAADDHLRFEHRRGST